MQAAEPQQQVIANAPAVKVQDRQGIADQFSDMVEPPVINLELFLNRDAAADSSLWQLECQKVAYSFHKFGICIVRDPRVNHEANESYIDMVERYFESVGEEYYAGGELVDMRPELSYQVGVTPESMEKARDHE